MKLSSVKSSFVHFGRIAVVIFITAPLAQGQLLDKLGKKVEQKTKQRIERKADRAIDKGLDKAEDILSGKEKGKQEQPAAEGEAPKHAEKSLPEEMPTNAHPDPFRIDSEYDFVSGARQIFFDDFSADAPGDFPAQWNTNGAGEVVTIENLDGRWLRIPDNTISFPETGSILPENFTVEFDLYYPKGVSRPPITFGFTDSKNPASEPIRHKKLFYYRITPSVSDQIGYSTSIYSGHELNKHWPANANAGKPIRVSIAVNGKRMRLYMDQSKMFDLPRAFEPEHLRNNFHLRSAQITPAPEDGFYIANLRIAEAGTDARSQLINDGKFSTTGIYFSSNAADIKPESAGVLQEIAATLRENPTLRISIIGHTDSDGDDLHNMELSKARAANVKAVLSSQYGIAPERMQANGKGEREPVADNSSPAGKAQNRRVEFIKL